MGDPAGAAGAGEDAGEDFARDGEGFEQKALFQMRFYALAWWRIHEVVPAMLQLLFLLLLFAKIGPPLPQNNGGR